MEKESDRMLLKGGWGGERKDTHYKKQYNCITLLYTWNYHNTVNQILIYFKNKGKCKTGIINIRKGISREKLWVGDNARSHTWIFTIGVTKKKKKEQL